ncbi:class I SAM-dependent methyltransferase [Egibacter rhizosphaerae]|uniref:Class I SAM-dependent methyltransferase n=1 Tax=Egibacter rhizosphaerae TaxID=1670831 RepID=A0A411YEB9_9ACTN|nr:class I SAM-dependent methyltransferase [Egibacter rhizosphaerae]QBI19603.1 class I SAM-dependent methyltransferase [Egibacter rhizosphaerae]
MTTDPYGDPELVALYDVDNPGGADHDFYRALAHAVGALRIVDLGCGTGLLTRSLATAGRSATGIDPSHTMLDWAQRQPGAENVTWIRGDATSIAPTGDIDLVLCTGNAIMHLEPDELATALERSSAALRPGGVLSFESRNPSAREWHQWTRDATYAERHTDLGRLTEWLEVADVAGQRVTFDAHNVLPDGADRVYTSVLYFRDADTLRTTVHDAGFDDVEIHGGWCGEDVTSTSRLLVVRARRA